MARRSNDLLHGTLDMLILSVLSDQERHGYEIAKRIELVSKSALKIGFGSLYPALYRLEKKGLVDTRESVSDEGRSIVVYSLTDAGIQESERLISDWNSFIRGVNFVVGN